MLRVTLFMRESSNRHEPSPDFNPNHSILNSSMSPGFTHKCVTLNIRVMNVLHTKVFEKTSPEPDIPDSLKFPNRINHPLFRRFKALARRL